MWLKFFSLLSLVSRLYCLLRSRNTQSLTGSVDSKRSNRVPKVEALAKSDFSDSDVAWMNDLELREKREVLRDEEMENPSLGRLETPTRRATSSDVENLRPGG